MGEFIPEPEQRLLDVASSEGIQSRDFSKPVTFDLKSSKPNKTVDLGRDGVSASIDSLGRILQLGVFHPQHGIIVAAPYKQFDGSRFYEPLYVRQYRTRMLSYIQDGIPGFGLQFEQNPSKVSIQLLRWNSAVFRFSLSSVLDVTKTVTVLESGELAQTVVVVNKGSNNITCRMVLNLGLSLNRASYGQLTEGGPVPLPKSRNDFRLIDDNKSFLVINPFLEASLQGSVLVNGAALPLPPVREESQADAPLTVAIPLDVVVPAGQEKIIEARMMYRAGSDSFRPVSLNSLKVVGSALSSDWNRDDTLSTYILRRNVDYVLANCVVPVSETGVAVITDHVALPLGWNRDNYWQIRLLAEAYENIENLVKPHAVALYAEQIRTVLRGHLVWVFKLAQRPQGFWHRSYLVTGVPKDGPIFQLDQQCYPILELCDYLDIFFGEDDFVRDLLSGSATTEIMQIFEAKRDTESGLWPTDETPGDDAVIYPYHFSSNVLLWRTFSRLRDLRARLTPNLKEETQRLDTLARDLRNRILSSFTATHLSTSARMFAYLTDAQGKHLFYHDANDVPTLLAREWDFVSTSTEIETWKNTMQFGFSPANKDGYCHKGKYPGLGSVHSPGSWVLGYYQELGFSAALDDAQRAQDVWRRIGAAMQWDGTFSEAVDPETAVCSSKAWFSWPGSMIGALIIQLRIRGTEEKLLGTIS